jgi:hypothetical protein
MFMAPFEYSRMATHPYVQTSPETHGHFAPTPLRHPSYSAPAIPFLWMRREGLEKRGEEYGIDVDPGREPDLGFETEWVQDKQNQVALTDCFAGHLRPERSLCFFYAKEVPFVEDPRRVIVGVGWVKHIGEATEYRYARSGNLKSILWERMIQHSIRPGFKNGFLMPCYELIEYAAQHQDFDPASATAFAPRNYFDEFSYASELVSHDAAIEALNNCAGALTRASGLLPGDYRQQIKWLHERLGELWKMRGPCPGLGVALCAFGIELGTFVAREIETKLEDNANPWPLVEKAFVDPRAVLSKESARQVGSATREKWKLLSGKRKALLKLLSRFNLLPGQAEVLYVQEEREKCGIRCTDEEIVGNPYLIYELTRLTEMPVSIFTLDRGLFPEGIIRRKHPLPEPSALDGGTDVRRVRALTIWHLEKAADEGHTLARKSDVVLAIRDLDIRPGCPVDSDLMNVAEASFTGAVDRAKLKDGSGCYQLARLVQVGKVIHDSVNKRCRGARHAVPENWRALLDRQLGEINATDRDVEERARVEKAVALKELAEARFSVLIGSAGTGKTTLLSILCGHPEIAKGDVLLLAPTGKARVKMEQAGKRYGARLKGYTIAQFLSQCDRYHGATCRYQLSSAPKEAPAKTVIVDECSMLTEEMLAALLDSVKGVERLILVGDPRQLPPIGAGRPFVDIVDRAAPQNVHSIFPRVGPGYAELTVQRRQGGSIREDVQLAEWFAGRPLEPGEDEVLDAALFGGNSPSIAFKGWETPEQFRNALLETLCEELRIASDKDLAGFNCSLGANVVNGYAYFNVGCGACSEHWQILSPVRKLTHGTVAINRLIHEKFRADMMEFARQEMFRKIPRPMGPEQIVYGDKVINARNHYRKHVYPEDNAAFYIANGETGLVVGQFRTKNMKRPPWLLKVEFSSQCGFAYDFGPWDFGEEAEPCLELAYALTVHKAQGSEYRTVILCVPNPCKLLSRELLYTALTRQTHRIVVLHQGARSELRKFTSVEFSEAARRLTNLFEEPSPIAYKAKFYEERLIHKTLRGELVRSKSELIIADRLHSNSVDYIYEHPLMLGGHTRYPDFTIEDAESGRTIYWEHCGLLVDPVYRRRWEAKLKWYLDNGVIPYQDGGGPNGTLVVTTDSQRGGISSSEIEAVVQKVIKA